MALVAPISLGELYIPAMDVVVAAGLLNVDIIVPALAEHKLHTSFVDLRHTNVPILATNDDTEATKHLTYHPTYPFSPVAIAYSPSHHLSAVAATIDVDVLMSL